ncbi:MAG: FHA domain-containing protein [Bacteroidota bacterium]
MRVKLTVVHTERGGEARTYVLEKDQIVMGRAGTCDLPLEDPDRVVSKRHAEIRTEGDVLRLFDMGSKNHTFVNGTRVGSAGVVVNDGDQFQMGPFEVTLHIERDVMVADDLDRTVFGAAFANPFAESAEAVAAAVGELRRAFNTLDYGHRADALRDALQAAMGPTSDARMLADLISPPAPEANAPSIPGPPASAPTAAPDPISVPSPPPTVETPVPPEPPSEASLDELFGPPVDELAEDPAASGFDVPPDDPFAIPSDLAPPAVAPFEPPDAVPPAPASSSGGTDSLHHALASVVARLISIPGKFRHEFLGHTVIHAPETAFLFDADVNALLQHLTPDDPALQTDRLQLLRDASEAVLHHHQSLLEGYRAAAREGAAVLVDGLDPDKIGDQAKGGGILQGGKEKAILDLVRERCDMMRGEDFAAAERRVYRPAFSKAYLDSLAYAQASSTDPL